MAQRENEATTLMDTPAESQGAGGSERGRSPQADPGRSPVSLYKPGQGTYVRWSTAAGAGLITVAAAAYAYDRLQLLGTMIEDPGRLLWIRTVISVAILALLSFLSFRFIGQSPRVVDFLIATEGEMRKVNWSTRREVIGATKIVIVTVLLLGFLLFIVDLLFIFFFSAIGVIRVPILKAFLGGD